MLNPEVNFNENISYCIEELFSPASLKTQLLRIEVAEAAFMELAYIFAREVKGVDANFVDFDDIGLEAMIARFSRDAYGIHYFNEKMNAFVENKRICKEDAGQIKDMVHDLSIRLNTTNPRKTRIAAAFSLWMAVFRPVYIKVKGNINLGKNKNIELFPAELNLWIACTYLKSHGNAWFGIDDDDSTVRINHILHDFTCRQISLSTLELLYSSIFNKETNSP